MHLGVITLCIVFPFDFVCCYKIRDFWFPTWYSLFYFQNVSTSKGSCCSQITVEVLQTATEGENQHFLRILKAMFILYLITFTPARKQYRIWLAFTHKNGDFDGASCGNGAKLRRADLSLKWGVIFRIGVHTICFSCRNEKLSAGLCCSRARWPLAPNVCSRATRKSQIFHTNHMLGALDSTDSEHWTSFNFP